MKIKILAMICNDNAVCPLYYQKIEEMPKIMNKIYDCKTDEMLESIPNYFIKAWSSQKRFLIHRDINW